MDSDRARELLRRERERIERALAGEAHAPDTDLATRDQHLGDQGSELYDDELAEGLREELAAELAAVKRAEERLAAGTYGLSIESGEPIPDDRLEAHPAAERTTEEQARLER
jgi:DnaK suppressor protein